MYPSTLELHPDFVSDTWTMNQLSTGTQDITTVGAISIVQMGIGVSNQVVTFYSPVYYDRG